MPIIMRPSQHVAQIWNFKKITQGGTASGRIVSCLRGDCIHVRSTNAGYAFAAAPSIKGNSLVARLKHYMGANQSGLEAEITNGFNAANYPKIGSVNPLTGYWLGWNWTAGWRYIADGGGWQTRYYKLYYNGSQMQGYYSHSKGASWVTIGAPNVDSFAGFVGCCAYINRTAGGNMEVIIDRVRP